MRGHLENPALRGLISMLTTSFKNICICIKEAKDVSRKCILSQKDWLCLASFLFLNSVQECISGEQWQPRGRTTAAPRENHGSTAGEPRQPRRVFAP